MSIPVIDTARETDYPTTCPLCQEGTKWITSGKGKHVGQTCSEHGIVGIRIHPAYRNQIIPPRTLMGKLKEWWEDSLRRA